MFKYYNPNPKWDGKNQGYKQIDCTVRSICAATDKRWGEVYLRLARIGYDECTMPHDMIVYNRAVKEYGFEVVKKCKKGELTVRDIANLSKKTKGIYLCQCNNHLVCCRNGYILDIFDSSEREVLKYWIKQ